ncbi:MAG: hypothetical protein ACI8P9_003301 [Parasphingorhabdus sp.]|jgi:hypothetical protein
MRQAILLQNAGCFITIQVGRIMVAIPLEFLVDHQILKDFDPSDAQAISNQSRSIEEVFYFMSSFVMEGK